MIIWEWRGRARLARSQAYPRHFRDVVVAELRKVSGFLGAYLSQRQQGDRVEFLVLTRWQSMNSIQAFAGSTAGKAVVEPSAMSALDDFDDTAQHDEVVEEVNSSSPDA
jgi:heme-degrading monooxygenase HmoA